MMDLPAERIVCALAEGESSWAAGYLDHLQALLASRWGRRVDLGALRLWLEDDPYALGLGVRADTLGFLVRHVADGGPVPVRRREFLALALRRWCGLLRAGGRTAAALSLEIAGAAALARAAGLAVRARSMSVPLGAFVRVFADALREATGASGSAADETTAAGAVDLMDTLIEAGLLLREAGAVRPAQDAVFVAALGREIAGDLHDSALLRAVVLADRWHPSLVAAAEELGDLSPVLAALDGLPAATRCLAMPALTRALLADVRASDAPALRTAFQRAIWWWAHWKADQRSATLSFGGPSRPDAPKAPEALIGGVAPLIALGMASRIHRRELGQAVTVESVLDGDHPRELSDYLALMDRPRPTDDAATIALMLAAPFQCSAVLNPMAWGLMPGAWPRATEFPGGITRDEYALWWRTVGAPRLAAEADGDARIAGTADGWSVTWGMMQTARGVDLWADALIRRTDADDPRAAVAFSEAVVLTLRNGGLANLRGLQRVWSGVRSARRRHGLRTAAAAAIPRNPDDWSVLSEVLVWMLTELADDAVRSELWSAWTNGSSASARHIPWKAFHSAGLAEAALMEWAVGTLPDQARSTGKKTSQRQGTGSQGSLIFQIFEPTDSPQALALDHLVENGSIGTLKALLSVPKEWSQKAIQRIAKENPDEHRVICVQFAIARGGRERMGVFASITPRRGETELWEAVARSAPTWSERLVRWCQVSITREDGEARWSEAWTALHLLDCVAAGLDRGEAPFLDVFGGEAEGSEAPVDGTDQDGPPEAPEEPKDVFRAIHAEMSPAVDTVLADVAVVLWLAWKEGECGVGELVQAVFDSEYLRPRVLGGFHHPWWVLAWELLGKDFVTAKLVQGHEDRPNHEATDWRFDGMAQTNLFVDCVLPLAKHEVLGDAAVNVIARRIVGTRPDLMESALTDRPLGVAALPNAATLALARRLAQASPDNLVGWLVRRVEQGSPALRAAWWAGVIPALPVGDARERAVAEWLEALA
jgi:hypothetical protein